MRPRYSVAPPIAVCLTLVTQGSLAMHTVPSLVRRIDTLPNAACKVVVQQPPDPGASKTLAYEMLFTWEGTGPPDQLSSVTLNRDGAEAPFFVNASVPANYDYISLGYRVNDDKAVAGSGIRFGNNGDLKRLGAAAPNSGLKEIPIPPATAGDRPGAAPPLAITVQVKRGDKTAQASLLSANCKPPDSNPPPAPPQ